MRTFVYIFEPSVLIAGFLGHYRVLFFLRVIPVFVHRKPKKFGVVL